MVRKVEPRIPDELHKSERLRSFKSNFVWVPYGLFAKFICTGNALLLFIPPRLVILLRV